MKQRLEDQDGRYAVRGVRNRLVVTPTLWTLLQSFDQCRPRILKDNKDEGCYI